VNYIRPKLVQMHKKTDSWIYRDYGYGKCSWCNSVNVKVGQIMI